MLACFSYGLTSLKNHTSSKFKKQEGINHRCKYHIHILNIKYIITIKKSNQYEIVGVTEYTQLQEKKHPFKITLNQI